MTWPFLTLGEILSLGYRGESTDEAVRFARTVENKISEKLGTQAAIDVLAERARQVSQEGWTPEHDDKHNECEMAAAAATYALCTDPGQLKLCGVIVWRWPMHWWKPTTYRRNLVKAAALLLAEIERIDRRAAKAANQKGGAA